MGKHIWRKHSYVQLKDDDPGCVWALFRIVNHHGLHSFKKLLQYKKAKTRNPTRKDKGKRKKRQQISMTEELQNMNSAPVIWGIFRYGLFSKKSNKTSIMTEDSSNSSPDLNQQSDMKPLDQDTTTTATNNNNNRDDFDLNAPTLLSLLKAHPYPKMINNSTHNREDKSNQINETSVAKNSKEDEMGMFEVYRGNQDLFLQMLQDSSSNKPRLVKSGTFPSPTRSRAMTLGRAPSKVEQKHNEIWPVMSNYNVLELWRSKSQGLGRTSSFNELFVRNGYLFDANGKGIKKYLSKSLKLTNEKDFLLLADLQGRRSFREVDCSSSLTSSEASRATFERLNSLSHLQTRGLNHKAFELHIDEKKSGFVVEPWQNNHQNEEEHVVKMESVGYFDTNHEITSSVSTSEACFEEDNPISPKDTLCVSKTMPTNENVDEIQASNNLSTHFDNDIDYYNEDLQYIKYVLDVTGFSSGEKPHPLDPAVFDAIEICCPFEPTTLKSPILSKDIANYDMQIMPSSQRKVLFDLVNEALISIHEKSDLYYPKALSSICHVHPMSKGKNRVVEELLEYISECLSWRPELDQTLVFAVAHEISDNKTGWMNLQRDSECLALDLGDLILDELLDEMLYDELLDEIVYGRVM